MVHDNVIIHTDGGSRGNPGPAAAAYVISDPRGHRIAGKGVFLGETTNNVAEYAGLARGLAAARDLVRQSRHDLHRQRIDDPPDQRRLQSQKRES